MLGRGKAVGAACGVGKSIGIAEAKVGKFQFVAHSGDKDVLGLEVEMDNLVGVQVLDYVKQFVEQAVGVGSALEKLRIDIGKLLERDAVYPFGEQIVIAASNVAHQVGVVEVVACLKLLVHCRHIARIGAQFCLQLLEKMPLAIEFYLETVAGGTIHIERLGIAYVILRFREMRCVHFVIV